jgi:hypothetical protein
MKTAYQVCQEMVECLDAEITAMKAEQRKRPRGTVYHRAVHDLANACSKLQGELRKTVDTADKAISMLPPERRVQLIMAELREMSPEYRSVVRAYLDELGEALL